MQAARADLEGRVAEGAVHSEQLAALAATLKGASVYETLLNTSHNSSESASYSLKDMGISIRSVLFRVF